MSRRWDSIEEREQNQDGYNVHFPNINHTVSEPQRNNKTIIDYKTPKISGGNKLRLLKDVTTRNVESIKSLSDLSKSLNSNTISPPTIIPPAMNPSVLSPSNLSPPTMTTKMTPTYNYNIKLNEEDRSEYYNSSRLVIRYSFIGRMILELILASLQMSFMNHIMQSVKIRQSMIDF
jgi:hypothetical protein